MLRESRICVRFVQPSDRFSELDTSAVDNENAAVLFVVRCTVCLEFVLCLRDCVRFFEYLRLKGISMNAQVQGMHL